MVETKECKITVTLLHYTPLHICSNAIRTCWQSFDKGDNGGDKDMNLIDRVGNKYKHASTLEHLYYNFYIQGISRACLQELARHRMASYSVKSSRYTLKELKDVPTFLPINDENLSRAEKFVVFTSNEQVNHASLYALERLREIVCNNVSNDIAKFAMPESYRTELSFSINARSLQNLLSLRSSKQALWEIRSLSMALFNSIPKEHQFIFQHCIESCG